jgi:peroxiredoxin
MDRIFIILIISIIILTGCPAKNISQSNGGSAQKNSALSTAENPSATPSSWYNAVEFKLAAAHFFVYLPNDTKCKDFELYDPNGKRIRLSDFTGKAVLLNFWGTYCNPCIDEIPEMVKLYEAIKDTGMVIVGVNVRESPAKVQEFTKKYKMTYPIPLDINGSATKIYAGMRLPTSYIIDPDGYIIAATAGMTDWNTPLMKEIFKLLVEKSHWKKIR